MNAEREAARRRAIERGVRYGRSVADSETGLIRTPQGTATSSRETLLFAIDLYLTGDEKDRRQAEKAVLNLPPDDETFGIVFSLVLVHWLRDTISPEARDHLLERVRLSYQKDREDIIAGRNNNIPLMAWAIRAWGGILFDDGIWLEKAHGALERLTRIVAETGTLPEFNSPTYQPHSLALLRLLAETGDERLTQLAEALERHLWIELAWRYHAPTQTLAGPHSRVYHDHLADGSSSTSQILDLLWGNFTSPESPARWDHAHEDNLGGYHVVTPFKVPEEAREIAQEKPLPVTVLGQALSVDYEMGDMVEKGGISDLTTYLHPRFALGSASRPFIHGQQTAILFGQWLRTEKERVEELGDLGTLFVRAIQNGRRPGRPNVYRNWHRGETVEFGASYWADDGRAFALQSGPRALVLYQPKRRERRWFQSLEVAVAIPRLETIDEIRWERSPIAPDARLIQGDPVVIVSGKVAVALRLRATHPELREIPLRFETAADHLLFLLPLVDLGREREMEPSALLRYSSSLTVDIREIDSRYALEAFEEELIEQAVWDDFVGLSLREVGFTGAGFKISGLFDQVEEQWKNRLTMSREEDASPKVHIRWGEVPETPA